mmetsp:Transcript_32880/g.81893  ORF Transcript_32880/g.81893 Transcript_32880/m.81893 type:complete len:214 (-) Transcript_32880:184-825(-)
MSKRFFGPELIMILRLVLIARMSPEVVPQYSVVSSSETAMHVYVRISFIVSISIGRTFRASGLSVHMRSALMPPVTRSNSERLSQVTVSAVSCAAGDPQMALPSATFQMTRLLSSTPPTEARYFPLGEKASACTITLCSRRRWRSSGGRPSLSPLRSHRMISARLPPLVIWPDAMVRPSLVSAMHVTESVCPCSSVWSAGDSTFRMTTVDPSG